MGVVRGGWEGIVVVVLLFECLSGDCKFVVLCVCEFLDLLTPLHHCFGFISPFPAGMSSLS